MSTPRRRRRDRDPLNQIDDAPETVPTATTEIPSLTESVSPEPTQDEIARRAYQLYEERGGQHGQDWDDWFQAERELRHRALHGVIDRTLGTAGRYAAA